MDSIKEGICAKFQDSEGRFSGVIPASDFYELLSLECPSLSESEKQAISIFAVPQCAQMHSCPTFRAAQPRLLSLRGLVRARLAQVAASSAGRERSVLLPGN